MRSRLFGSDAGHVRGVHVGVGVTGLPCAAGGGEQLGVGGVQCVGAEIGAQSAVGGGVVAQGDDGGVRGEIERSQEGAGVEKVHFGGVLEAHGR